MTKWIFTGNVILEHLDKFYSFVKDREYEVTEIDSDVEVRLNDNKSVLLPKIDFERYFIKTLPTEKVFHSSHYHSTGIEPIEFINSNNMGFCRGNIIKYGFRVGKKQDQEKGDIKKIIDYTLMLAFKKDIAITEQEIIDLVKYRFDKSGK